ncbi:MAG: polysaccharide biosynthesis C-terminal domain-containing protein, partial [Gemmatimonadaceae bacterium]|nr:polysaccharide biosynthesis C-terminal domain-containing protein [Chitinophagaceae bacterium]
LYSGMVLLCLSIPLNIYMARWQGMEGVAIATLTTFTIYNFIRLVFIRKRFNMWPFTDKTIYAIVLAAVTYGLVYILLRNLHGITGILLRSFLFSVLFIGGAWVLHLTPDLREVYQLMRTKLGLRNTEKP